MTTCNRAIFEGEVSFGKEFDQLLGGGLRFMLEPLASGWIIRVLPATGPRGHHDYAELATPPYRSITPLLVGTDYSFRAQDAVGWNPRRFRWAADAEQFRALSAAYEDYMAAPSSPNAPAQEAKLVALAYRAPEAEFNILDARLIPGQADQAMTASTVVSHFTQTAHTLEQPDGKENRELGRVTWLRFRVRMDLPSGSMPARGLREEQYACPILPKPTYTESWASQR